MSEFLVSFFPLPLPSGAGGGATELTPEETVYCRSRRRAQAQWNN